MARHFRTLSASLAVAAALLAALPTVAAPVDARVAEPRAAPVERVGWHGVFVFGPPVLVAPPPPVIYAPPPPVIYAPPPPYDAPPPDWAERHAYREGYRDGLRRRWEIGDRVDPRAVVVIAEPWRWGFRPAPYGYGYVALGDGVFVMSLATGALVDRIR